MLTARQAALAGRADAEVIGVVDTAAVDVLVDDDVLQAMLAAADVVCLGGPSGGRFMAARAAARQGVHALLEWPPATSMHEGEAIMRLADEAGTTCRVSRPLRRHPLLAAWPVGARARLVTLQLSGIPSEARWSHVLADACDLVCYLTGSYSVQRIEAEAVRGYAAHPGAVAFSIRFHNGSYAQVSLQRSPSPYRSHLYAGNRDHHLDTDLDDQTSALIASETNAFIGYLGGGAPAAVSLLDGLCVMRIVETLMQQLR